MCGQIGDQLRCAGFEAAVLGGIIVRSLFKWLFLSLPVWLLIAPAAHANMIWPALFVAPRQLSVPAVAVGLLVEILVLKRLLGLSWLRTIGAVVAANVVSAFVGLFLIPISGVVWELGPGLLMNFALNIGTFNPVTWGATFVMATLINAALEMLAIRFALSIWLSWRQFGWWVLANAITVAIAAASIWIEPPDTSGDWYDPWPFDAGRSTTP